MVSSSTCSTTNGPDSTRSTLGVPSWPVYDNTVPGCLEECSLSQNEIVNDVSSGRGLFTTPAYLRVVLVSKARRESKPDAGRQLSGRVTGQAVRGIEGYTDRRADINSGHAGRQAGTHAHTAICKAIQNILLSFKVYIHWES